MSPIRSLGVDWGRLMKVLKELAESPLGMIA